MTCSIPGVEPGGIDIGVGKDAINNSTDATLANSVPPTRSSLREQTSNGAAESTSIKFNGCVHRAAANDFKHRLTLTPRLRVQRMVLLHPDPL
jgi:hypothetical protein